MKNISKKRTVKFTASALIVLVLFCVAAPSAHAESICRRALTKCLVDAAIALILSGPQAAAIFASGCLNGYIWCITYYVDF
ncbi:hypothetical protein ACFLRW_03180 [Acidobacteriota bacterium]